MGEDGVRGNQVAPAASSNKSSLNSHNETNAVSKQIKSPVAPVVDDLAPFAADLISNSPELDQGFDIASLTAKLDPPLEADTATNSSKPVSSEHRENGLSVKIQPPKANKKGERKSSVSGTKSSCSQEKSHLSEKPLSPKKQVKTSKKELKTPKNSTSAKVSNVIEKTVHKTSKLKVSNDVVAKKSTKKKVEMKSSGAVVTKQEPVKSVSEVDEEDVIVDIVSVENSPVKSESKLASTLKTKETEKPKVAKSKPTVTNGHGLNKPVSGEKLFSTLISPSRTKEILGKNVEITYDEVNKPESLIVKIDLSLLKRIPKLPGNELIKQEQIKQEHTESLPVVETNGIKDAICSPEVKIPKRKSSVTTERETPKKVKSESDVDSSQ